MENHGSNRNIDNFSQQLQFISNRQSFTYFYYLYNFNTIYDNEHIQYWHQKISRQPIYINMSLSTHSTFSNQISHALALLDTLHHSERPLQLENYIQSCSKDQKIIEGFLEAIQSHELDTQATQKLCMLVSKVLMGDDLAEECQLKIFMRLILNWSLPEKSKQMFEADLKKFLKYINSENMNYFYHIIDRLQQIISEIAQKRELRTYQSSPIEMKGFQVTIVLSFPKQFVPMAQTYLYLVKNVLLQQNDLIQMLKMTEDFHYLKLLHYLIFQPKNIQAYPELFSSLFQFYLELNQLQIQGREDIERLVFQNWDFLTANLALVYECLCDPYQREGINYICMKPHQNQQQILKLKSQASEFHLNLLRNLAEKNGQHMLIEQLTLLYPSIVMTIDYFLHNYDHEESSQEYFIKNMLALFAINLQQSKQTQEHALSVFNSLVLPFAQYAIDAAQQKQIVGQSLHFLLDNCCEQQSSGNLLSESILTIEKMLKKYKKLQLYLLEYAKWSLKHRFFLKGQISLNERLPKPLQTRTVFLLLSILADNDHQSFLSLCHDIGELISQQFLQNLSQIELPYFYYFLQYSVELVCQGKPNNYDIIIDFGLTSGRQNLQYFALQFIKNIFWDNYRIEWIMSYIRNMQNFKTPESIAIKWQIFHIIVNQKIIDMKTEDIVQIIHQVTMGAQKQLQRMQYQKKYKIAVDYGQIRQYMGSLRNFRKKIKLRLIQKQILEALLNFLYLIDLAGQVHAEKEIVKMASQIIPFCQNSHQLSNKGLVILQKLLLTFIQNYYDGHLTLIAIFSCINTFHQQQQTLSLCIVRTLQFGSQFLVKSTENQEIKCINRSLANLITLFIKYLTTLGGNYQDQQSLSQIFDRIKAVSEFLLSKYGQAEAKFEIKRIKVKYRLLQIIFALLKGYQLDYNQLMLQTRQNWFLDYNAFLILHAFTSLIDNFSIEARKKILYIGIQLLASQQLEQIRKYKDEQSKKNTLYAVNHPKDPLDQIHFTVDDRFYQPNIAEQAGKLFESCNIHSWDDCRQLMPEFSQNYYCFLEYCRRRPVLTQRQNILDYISQKSMIIAQINKELQGRIDIKPNQFANECFRSKQATSKRKILKVIGDKLSQNQNSLFIQSKTSFKRDNLSYRSAIFQQEQNDLSQNECCFDEGQESDSDSIFPSKKIIDNYFVQHKTIKMKTQSSSYQSEKQKRSIRHRRQRMQALLATSDLGRLFVS